MSEPHQGLKAPETEHKEQAAPSLLDQIVAEGKVTRDPEAKERGKDLVRQFVTEVLKGHMAVSADTESMINARIGQIDRLLSKQLNEILHHPEFQQLEASWRGLRYLLDRTETSTTLKIKVLNVAKSELQRDLQKASEFDQSALFKRIYTEEYSQFGGDPFGALIGDYEFGRSSEDMDLLTKISNVAAAAHAPFLSAASPELLNLDGFTKLGAPRDLAAIFEQTEYVKWRSFRESDDSRYVGLCLPRMLIREPYGKGFKSVDTFQYEEGVDGSSHDKYLWANAAYALGARLTDAFARHGWTVAIRGVQGGGLVEGLPAHTFRSTDGDIALKCPTEVAIDDRREKELGDLGFIPLVHCRGRDFAAFFSINSAQKPKVFNKDEATASARLSSQLPYLFSVCRFAHYLKSIMRDRIGSMMSREDCERELNEWITGYVTPDATALESVKASHPLFQARIDVTEMPGKPGVYRAIAYLRPHFQLDELNVSLRLVAELPAAAKG